MTEPSAARLIVFLDEGVPSGIGQVFEDRGHEVIPFNAALKGGSKDVLVATTAMANSAVLVAYDRDMRQLARRTGLDSDRFKRLSLIQFECSEPMSIKRLEQAMTLIEHEWAYSEEKVARRLHVSIGKHVIKTHR